MRGHTMYVLAGVEVSGGSQVWKEDIVDPDFLTKSQFILISERVAFILFQKKQEVKANVAGILWHTSSFFED